MTRALCPGSFDPITNGHLDIVERASRIFDEVYVTIFHNPGKEPLFSVEERIELCREATAGLKGVTIDTSQGLLTHYAREKGIHVIIKGLRAVSDFEYEFQMAQMNKRLDEDFETFFMMTRPEHSYLSSSIVKEVARFGGRIAGLVPPVVERRLLDKYGRG